MAKTTSYEQFDATKADSFWACETSCTLSPHQSNLTAGVNDMLLVRFNIVGNVQAMQFANQQVSFTWGFNTCSTTQFRYPASILSQIVGLTSRGYKDALPICPEMNRVSHTGTTTLGSDGILGILFVGQLEYGDFPEAYMGSFVLRISSQETGLSSPSSGTSLTTGSSATATSGGSSNTGTTAGNNNASNLPLLTASWSSVRPYPSPVDSPETDTSGNTEGTSFSRAVSNRNITIGGVAGGIGAVLLIAIAIWFLYRQRKRTAEAEISGGRISPLKHEEKGRENSHSPEDYHTEPATSRAPQPQRNIWRRDEKTPVLSASSNSTDDTFPVVDVPCHFNPPQIAVTHDHALSTLFSATGPPAYDIPPNEDSDPFLLYPVTDQHGPYTLDDTFQVHDLLGEWAEEYRDAVPYHLERRLRAGGYIPGTHPNEISSEVWLRRFAVTRYELAGLIELFERTNGMPSHRPRSRTSTERDGDGE